LLSRVARGHGQPVDCSSRAVEELGRSTAYAVQRVAGGIASPPRSLAFCKYKRRHVMTPRRPDLDHLDREMRDHIEEETHENVARGMSEEEARAAAIRKFGNVARIREDVRGVWIPGWLD